MALTSKVSIWTYWLKTFHPEIVYYGQNNINVYEPMKRIF